MNPKFIQIGIDLTINEVKSSLDAPVDVLIPSPYW